MARISEIFNTLWNDPRTLTQIMVASLMAASFSAFMPKQEPDENFTCRSRFGEAVIYRDAQKGRTLTLVKSDHAQIYEGSNLFNFQIMTEMAQDFCAGVPAPNIRTEYVHDKGYTPFYVCVSHDDRKSAVLVDNPQIIRILRAGGPLKENDARRMPGRLQNGMYYAREHCLGNTIKLP